MEPCRKCGKPLESAKHFLMDAHTSSSPFGGTGGMRSTSSISHRPCPYCKDPKPLFARELKTYTTNLLRLLIAASLCGLYFVLDPQLFDAANQSINSLVTLTIGWTGGLFAVLAILTGVSYLKKKNDGK
jgi:hypothetical protein